MASPRKFLILALLAMAATALASCSGASSCSACTMGSGDCRWCFKDGQCHAYGSVENPCSVAEDITDPADCSNETTGYDPNIAYTMALLSAAAYSDDPQGCMHNSLHLANFNVVGSAWTLCDWAKNDCFMFTAVSTVDRVVVLSFRGSDSASQVLLEALECLTEPTHTMASGGQVQDYFYKGYAGLQVNVTFWMTQLMRQYPDYAVWVTGHSLGGSLASIAVADLAYRGVISNPLQYTFGEPRTGNRAFADGHDALAPQSWRVVHYRDIVPHVPPCHSEKGMCTSTGNGTRHPYHHGTELFYYEKNMAPGVTTFRECLGQPLNEDEGCSNGVVTEEPCVDIITCVCYHTHYFNVDLGNVCGSPPPPPCSCCS